ncbi:MAG: hypothetical protein QM687_13000 [Ferruginibacter sp.]
MRLAKGFLIVLAGFFILITLISFLFPSTVVTVKSATVHAPESKIMAAVTDLQEWKKWNPVFMQPGNELKISSPSTGNNARADWMQHGKSYSISFTNVFDKGVQFNVNSPGEKPVETSLAVLPMQEPGTYQVEWRAINRLKWYPWEKFAGIFVSEMTGPGYQQALESLQKYIEHK